MIQLLPGCMIMQTESGDTRLCTIEAAIMESRPDLVEDSELAEDIAAVLSQYFAQELKKSTVTYTDFTVALRIICQFLKLPEPGSSAEPSPEESTIDLLALAQETGTGFEILFFQLLRGAVDEQVQQEIPRVVINRSREAVIALLGAKKWSPRCERFRDQIVNFVRDNFAMHNRMDQFLLIS